MQIIADLHTHTLASGHAYASYIEMAQAAGKLGLKAIGITDHGPEMPGSCHPIYFWNLIELSRHIDGVRVIRGIEANIVDDQGEWDMDHRMFRSLELIITSLHNVPYDLRTEELCTGAIIKAMKHSESHIVGHPDAGRMPVDTVKIARAAAENNKILEVNNHSLEIGYDKAAQSYLAMLEECKALNIPIVVNSDAHDVHSVGLFHLALPLLEKAAFPEHLVANASEENLQHYLGIDLN